MPAFRDSCLLWQAVDILGVACGDDGLRQGVGLPLGAVNHGLAGGVIDF